ncbi:MAG TPA: endolytic transglycosylase MltG, partial [Clostridiales bacterium]|nr:endolytic transglycosylase MltG [Clostridiales bacterium]
NCKGLPVGPICNPGDDAIKAVLWPKTTGYYFFAHDEEGKLYLARTANEQNANVNKAAKSSSSGSDQ